MDLYGYVRHPGFSVLESSSHVVGGDSDVAVIHHPDVLRGWIRNDAGVYGRLFRVEECGANLWPDDDGVGLCQCIRLAAVCAPPPDKRIVCERAPFDRERHVYFCRTANPGEAAQIREWLTVDDPMVKRD